MTLTRETTITVEWNQTKS